MAHKARLSHANYTVGWICALPIEMAATQALLDEVHEGLPVHENGHNTYTLGAIGEHNVVLCCLPSGIYGTSSARGVAVSLLSSFPSIRFGLMVGIGGEVPSKDVDIRLGDVVVNNLGLVYTNLGKLQDAEQMCQGALVGREGVVGASHVSTLESVNNLGFLYSRKGNLSEATRLYKKALACYEKELGPNDTFTLDIINNLGLLYTKCGNLKEAGNMYKRAIDGFEKLLGPNHTSTLIVANDLADFYHSEGRIPEARNLYERALAGYKNILGPDHK